MIFLNNVYITNEQIPVRGGVYGYDRGLFPHDDKLDVYKYSLASLAKAYPWTKAIIYCQLDETYKSRESELRAFVEEMFEGVELIFRSTRNEYIKDWAETYELLNDDLIWFCCNHDHIFVDRDSSYLEEYVAAFRKKYAAQRASIYFSHWSEMLCRPSVVEEVDNVSFAKWGVSDLVDSVQILTKKLYEEWWMGAKWRGGAHSTFFPRPDFSKVLFKYKKLRPWEVFVPLKELCRHFDGYGHTAPKIENSDCPVLSIPMGFFEKDIKIHIGEQKKEGYIHFNPLAPEYSAVSKSGADYKWLLEDIPFFWKDRISSITVEEELDLNKARSAKKRALIDIIFSHSQHWPRKRDFIQSNMLNEILKLYGYKRVLNEE